MRRVLHRLAADLSILGVVGDGPDWNDPERIVDNLHRAYAELDGGEWGEHLDLGPIVADMVTYNDGERLRCLA